MFSGQTIDHVADAVGFLTGPADVDQDVATACRLADRIDGFGLQTKTLNRIEIREIQTGKTEIAIVLREGEGVAVAESNATILVAITRDRVHGPPVEQIDNTDDSTNQLPAKQIVQADLSASLGSEKSDSTLTMA